MKETVDKSIDFLFEDACFRFRALPKVEDSVKEDVIKRAQAFIGPLKAKITQTLIGKGIKVIFSNSCYQSPTNRWCITPSMH